MIRIATAVRHDMSRRAFRASCGVIVLLYLGLGLFYSRTLISWDDESSFLALGEMAITGPHRRRYLNMEKERHAIWYASAHALPPYCRDGRAMCG